MIPPRLARYHQRLDRLAAKGYRRGLTLAAGHDFTSNDYLGLAGSALLAGELTAALARGVPAGAGGSRLLRGHHPEHQALEAEAAAFFGCPQMLYFGSGYTANLALLATLPQADDLVVHDRLIHASLQAGIAAGRAKALAAGHNDPAAVAAAITDWRAAGGRGTPWIVVESLYSMDGDRAPLAELMAIADRHDGFLVIDEAHTTGVAGPGGRGLAAAWAGRDNVLIVHGCGKALGLVGALLGGPAVLCDYLISRAAPFIYATAPTPLQAAGVRAALMLLHQRGDQWRQALDQRQALANRLITDLGGRASGSQILPLVIGDNHQVLTLAEQLRGDGFDLRAIRPPTVPIGTARLRIAITLNVTPSTIEALFDRLRDRLAALPPVDNR